ncbi:metalloregulator ArsR/SmtB family transcription factor [Isoptericola sp. NEAU-Y5]|uniref:Metalloregulator ArsR/SmtB family transcription factor n=1 Tax=Isoptericola luteus TaxID=2879484 RepID=A0ABS7ZKN2_9MICO|nr:metalloregulator ArsR/SmtB family transcription factor [Isoptericola sp. NEAU-Y5]MCA5894204.1 metalloregulator ArsR/SmtB family transcription factor [Isoptericola sp. NEAU-Y5]
MSVRVGHRAGKDVSGRDFTAVGRALAAPVRSTVLNLLIDGSSRPAGELARAAGVRPSTASEHLAALVDAGFVVAEPRGRQRFFRLADARVADALETLGELCPPAPVVSLRQSREQARLARARLCYDHLAGRLGVAVTDAMVGRGWLGDGLVVTSAGRTGLVDRGVDVDAAGSGRRPLTRACPDWTERREHLAGALGAAVAGRFLAAGWVARRGSTRGLAVTEAGLVALADEWGVPADLLDVPC